ncbi:hypothetical protein BVC80_1685g19 [Macleaya cordata]|uniref:Uncharacterized protein n=1 Tax=Macleaya cordata TaxID=56857 RepID=A0A200RAP5_MACCD|nr:hypothetical protein BVC80_1685g19 [Macleaya cordata]
MEDLERLKEMRRRSWQQGDIPKVIEKSALHSTVEELYSMCLLDFIFKPNELKESNNFPSFSLLEKLAWSQDHGSSSVR